MIEMKMMSRCFTWFPISGLGKPKLYQNMWCFTRNWEDCGGCLTCEELSGGYLQGMMGEGVYSLYVTP